MAAKILIQGSIVRAIYGITTLLFPGLVAASVGMSEDEVGPEARYFVRLFGGRDLMVAAGTAAAVRAGEEGKATAVNLACEFTDSVSLVGEVRSRGGIDKTLTIGLLFNLFGYLTWLRALAAGR
jgi:hypothetical protein